MMSNSYFRAPEATDCASTSFTSTTDFYCNKKNNSHFISNAEFTLNLSIENETDISQQINFFLFILCCLQLPIEY